jgi:hypothetical protein
MRAALAPGSAAEDGRAAAARRAPLEIVEKVLTNSVPLNENCSRSLKAAILRDGQAAATNGARDLASLAWPGRTA